MKPFIRKIMIRTLLPKNKRESHSTFELARGVYEWKMNMLRITRDILFIVVGIFSAAFGFKGFLLNNHFIDGGATGISLLVSALTTIPLWVLIIGINIPFVSLGYKTIGKTFAIKTALAITRLALCLATIHFPVITNDNLLVAVFGGFFLGAGIGLSVRGGAVIDGTEVLAIYLSRKLGATIGDIIVVINVFVFLAAAYFLSVEIALYSMITYLSASRTLNFIVEGIEEFTGVSIISVRNEEIRKMIIEKMGRGVTIYSGRRGYGKRGETKEVDIVYTVVTRLELNKLNTEIATIDPNAFVVMSSVKDTRGGMIKKRPLKH
jgi:uncharacterized membrane-anchored protein YitT (DUF2179 family)